MEFQRWSVVGSCSISKAYSAQGRYKCQWFQKTGVSDTWCNHIIDHHATESTKIGKKLLVMIVERKRQSMYGGLCVCVCVCVYVSVCVCVIFILSVTKTIVQRSHNFIIWKKKTSAWWKLKVFIIHETMSKMITLLLKWCLILVYGYNVAKWITIHCYSGIHTALFTDEKEERKKKKKSRNWEIFRNCINQ